MQITPDELLAEAGRMALEIRFKDAAIAHLHAEVEKLREQRSAPGTEVDDVRNR